MYNNRRLISMLRQTGILFPLTILFGFLGSALVVFQSYELSKTITQVFLEGKGLKEVTSLFRFILIIVMIRVVFTLLN